MFNFDVKQQNIYYLNNFNNSVSDSRRVGAYLGYYPLTYKGLLFYAVDSATLMTSETFRVPKDDGYLYAGPNKSEIESKTINRISASYKVDGNTITFQLEPLPVVQELIYRYAFVNNSFKLAVGEMDGELEVKPLIYREV